MRSLWIDDLITTESGSVVDRSLFPIRNSITDLGPLEALSSLVELRLTGTAVGQIEPRQGLTRLEVLDLSADPERPGTISDLSPIQMLPLRTLYLRSQRLTDLNQLLPITTLFDLDIGDNGLSSVASLPARSYNELRIDHNPLVDYANWQIQSDTVSRCSDVRRKRCIRAVSFTYRASLFASRSQ